MKLGYKIRMDLEPTEKEPSVTITAEKLRDMISRLRPDKEVFAGRKFFEKLLADGSAENVDRVLRFIEKASKALDKNDGLDLHFNFDAAELTAFHKSYPPIWTRRAFLNTFGWGLPGAVYAFEGIVGLFAQFEEFYALPESNPKREEHDTLGRFGAIKKTLSTLTPTTETLIGLALVQEAFDKWVEIKLEQIADAVDVLAQQTVNKKAESTAECHPNRR